jgi:hypothetical protein
MSKSDLAESTDREQGEPQGPNLKLLYGLIALALVAAIAIAAFIVFPFYQRR